MKYSNEIIQNTKGILTMITGLLAYMVDAITELVIVLVVLMFIDYGTGMISSFVEKKWNSNAGINGAAKKVGFVLLVLIAVLTDYVIMNLGQKLGITLGFTGLFTLAVTCWLISTELLSITENLGRLGVPIPKFLKNAFIVLKDTSEDLGNSRVGGIAKFKEKVRKQ
ncbi:phage holin family protein [Sporosalibacterium faouarense]|uniref:phage holin family protein n=1 Tax=Sporosalibacterium faouarense TaxID=516123 RepID=UPI00141C4ABF|nr:phage holin family protein [Sporosalibacterium faouarense]MTI46656.1 phage holin family protein [Bacillota bacterium]